MVPSARTAPTGACSTAGLDCKHQSAPPFGTPAIPVGELEVATPAPRRRRKRDGLDAKEPRCDRHCARPRRESAYEPGRTHRKGRKVAGQICGDRARPREITALGPRASRKRLMHASIVVSHANGGSAAFPEARCHRRIERLDVVPYDRVERRRFWAMALVAAGVSSVERTCGNPHPRAHENCVPTALH